MPRTLWSRRAFNKGVISVAGVSGLMAGSPLSWAAGSSETLKIRLLSEPMVLDPAFWQSSADVWLMEALLPKLAIFKAGKEWGWEKYAAKVLKQADEKTVHFELIEGIEWSNGFGELTAEDVKFSFERFLNKELQSPIAGNWELLDQVEVTGKYTGNIRFKKPFAALGLCASL